MHFKRFEEMPVWQDARKLTTNVYTLAQGRRFRTDFGLKDQIQRASVSVMSNIAEGYERTSKKEFLAFLGYAKGSIGEVRSQLYVAFDLGYINLQQFECARNVCVSISTQLTRFAQCLKNEN